MVREDTSAALISSMVTALTPRSAARRSAPNCNAWRVNLRLRTRRAGVWC